MVLAEGVGEDLEVLEVLVFGGRIELHTRHGKIEEDAVVDLAERSAVNNTVSVPRSGATHACKTVWVKGTQLTQYHTARP